MYKHLTHTGPTAGDPICGASWSEKAEGSIHFAYYRPERDGCDFCPKCLELACEIDQDLADSYELARLASLGRAS